MLDNSFPPSDLCHVCDKKPSTHISDDNWYLCFDCYMSECVSCADCECIMCGTIAMYSDIDGLWRCQTCYGKKVDR